MKIKSFQGKSLVAILEKSSQDEVQGILPQGRQGDQIQGCPLPLGQLPLSGIPAGSSLHDDPDSRHAAGGNRYACMAFYPVAGV